MRQEIQYALALMHWLALEGGRCTSVEELWSDLVFAAQRLGYSSVKLTLADGQKIWEQTNGCQPTRSVVQVLHGGNFGTLELKAPSCGTATDSDQWMQECERSFCPRVSDVRMFEIVSELVAEGWVNAIRKFKSGDDTPLRIDAKSSAPNRRMQSRSARSINSRAGS
jgi:hypothetical protein